VQIHGPKTDNNWMDKMKVIIAESIESQQKGRSLISILLSIFLLWVFALIFIDYGFIIDLLSGIKIPIYVYPILPILNIITTFLTYSFFNNIREINNNERIIQRFKDNYYKKKELPKLLSIKKTQNNTFSFRFSYGLWHVDLEILIHEKIFREIHKIIDDNYRKINGRIFSCAPGNKNVRNYTGEDAEDLDFLNRLIKQQFERVQKVIQLYMKVEHGEITAYQYASLLSK